MRAHVWVIERSDSGGFRDDWRVFVASHGTTKASAAAAARKWNSRHPCRLYRIRKYIRAQEGK